MIIIKKKKLKVSDHNIKNMQNKKFSVNIAQEQILRSLQSASVYSDSEFAPL